MTFAKNLKSLRIQKNITMKELAEEIGSDKGTISKYEAGVMTPNMVMLKKIARYFNVTMDWLAGD